MASLSLGRVIWHLITKLHGKHQWQHPGVHAQMTSPVYLRGHFKDYKKVPEEENRLPTNNLELQSPWRLRDSKSHFLEWVATAPVFPKESEKMMSPETAQFCQTGLLKVSLFSFFSATLCAQSFSCLSSRKRQSTAILNTSSWRFVQQILEGIGCGSFIKKKIVTVFYVSQKQRKAGNSWWILKRKNPVVSWDVNIFHSLKNWVS